MNTLPEPEEPEKDEKCTSLPQTELLEWTDEGVNKYSYNNERQDDHKPWESIAQPKASSWEEALARATELMERKNRELASYLRWREAKMILKDQLMV
ncbi:hypothetical protein L2E82_39466 [Cichorium intybus]|uniref:Uncharacterized protein n=1 Tax=Cichorium intybus TaxID=13427 RepID=A0ACB9AIB9_CICIN|nr:hypothetical protein L2E82_39466 [Cichorium intybus]